MRFRRAFPSIPSVAVGLVFMAGLVIAGLAVPATVAFAQAGQAEPTGVKPTGPEPAGIEQRSSGEDATLRIYTPEQVVESVEAIRSAVEFDSRDRDEELRAIEDALVRLKSLDLLARTTARLDPLLKKAIIAAYGSQAVLRREGITADRLNGRALELRAEAAMRHIGAKTEAGGSEARIPLEEMVAIQRLYGELQEPGARIQAAVVRARLEEKLDADDRLIRSAFALETELRDLEDAGQSVPSRTGIDDAIVEMIGLVADAGAREAALVASRLLPYMADGERARVALVELARRNATSGRSTEEAGTPEEARTPSEIFLRAAAASDLDLRGTMRDLIERNTIDLASALSFLQPAQRNATLLQLVEELIDQDKPLNAPDLAQRIDDVPMRADAYARIALDLLAKGYRQAASEAVTNAMADLPDDPARLERVEEMATRHSMATTERFVTSTGAADGDELRARAALWARDDDALRSMRSGGSLASPMQALADLVLEASKGGDGGTAGGLRSAFDAYPELSSAVVARSKAPASLASAIEILASAPNAGDGPLSSVLLERLFELDPKAIASVSKSVAAILVKTGSSDDPASGARLAALANVDPSNLPNALRGALDGPAPRALSLAWNGSFDEAYSAIETIGGPAARRDRTLIAVARIDEARGDAKRAVERLRGVVDYRLRVPALRASAERAAGRLDHRGLLTAGTRADPVAVQATPVVLGESSTSVLRDGRMALSSELAVPQVPLKFPAERTALGAADIRARVPVLPPAGPSGLSVAGVNRFAQLNRFSAKFFEDIVGMSARDYLYEQQGSINPVFLYLTEGVFTAKRLQYLSIDGRFPAIEGDKDGFMFRTPIVIGPQATLVLSGQEAKRYRLSASRGSFIVNAGRLFISDTTLEAYDERAREPKYAAYKERKNFRPFILSWSGSETYIGGSRIVALGYSAGKSYGLSLSSGPDDAIGQQTDASRPRGQIVDTSFDNMLYGFYSYEADGVDLVGNEYVRNIVYGLDPHDRSRDLMLAYNTAYGTMEKHGGIVSREVDDSYLVGNLTFDNRGSGLMIDRDSSSTLIYANTSFGNDQDGLTVYESPCSLVEANDFSGNGRAGIKVRNSWDVNILRNRLAGNKEAAIEGYIAKLEQSEASLTRDFELDPYSPVSTFYASGNEIAGNGAGIRTNGASAVTLGPNMFRDQTYRMFDGDLAEQGLWIYRYMADDRNVTLTSSCVPKLVVHKGCPLFTRGVVASHTNAGRFGAQGDAGLCLGDVDSVQAEATTPVGQ